MRAVVVYESMFGNTESVARSVGAGLAPYGEVEVVEVGDALPQIADDDLLVVGGPTHAFGMTRESTRQDARKRTTHEVVSQRLGVRDWLASLPGAQAGAPVSVAVFDTKVHKARRLPGAARGAAKALQKRGYRPLAVQSFYVDDVEGPLMEGELERAAAWAAMLAQQVKPARR
ncbi:MAG TPA: flavodoxin domain-containing protein [Nocardioidaceae bacterium]|nr:flavodoxin domain-containing protein [Nocardioidaceae bacterium]